MEKKRISLIFLALCLVLAFSVSSVEAQLCEEGAFCDRDRDGFFKDHKRCVRMGLCAGESAELDCNDNFFSDDNTDCGGGDPEPDPDPLGSPIIALVSNKFHTGSAVGHIAVNHFSGSYTNVSLRDFNRLSGGELRAEFDVLHIQWGSPSSMRVTWEKLRDFMNAVPDPCGGEEEPECIGGSILHEDPQNVLELEVDGLRVSGVEHHAETDVVIVEFEPSLEELEGMYNEPEEILSAFTALDPDDTAFNGTGYFLPVPTVGPLVGEDFCLDHNPLSTIQTLGLGYGCFNNNHMTFFAEQDMLVELTPFLKLEGSPEDPEEAVGLYGEFGPGRILFTGPDSAVHSVFVASPFHANSFCLLTNELIWLSQDYLGGDVISDARDNCVENAEIFRVEQGQPVADYPPE